MRTQRLAAGLTQELLAERAGISVHGVQKLEQEVTRPYRDTVQRLARALDLSATDRDAFEEAARRRPRQPAATVPPTGSQSRLPLPSTSFVGREAELRSIAQYLAEPSRRLLTLIGPGGVGKTRLAIEAARQQIGAYEDGVHFVALAPVQSSRLVNSAIGEVLGITLSGPESAAMQLARYLRDKRVLLVLDNFEHVLGAIDTLIDLLREPGVKLLVTSRERLNVQDEFVFEVGGLNFPNDSLTDDPGAYTAVELFAQRARQVQPTFSLADNIQSVIDICRQLDGLPLGLELAVTWLRVMPCREVAAQIQRDLDFLVTPMRDVAKRHRSLRAVLDHSWNLLLDAEQRVLARLSVFRGGFDLESAGVVASGSLPVLASLVDKSLVRVSASGRYELQEPLRQYLAERLQEYAETKDVADRHLQFYMSLGERSEAALHGPQQLVWFDRLELEQGNIAAALSWSLTDGRLESGLRLANAIGFFWELRSHWFVANDWFTRLVEQPAELSPLVRANTLRWATVFAEYTGRWAWARDVCEEGLALARESGDRWTTAWVLATKGMYVDGRTDPDGGRQLLEEALAIFREIGDGWGISHVLRRLAINLTLRGEYASARPLLEEALTDARAVGDQNALVWSLYLLGNLLWLESGDVVRASQLLEEAMELLPPVGDLSNKIWVMFTLAAAARVRGRFEQAESCYAQVLGLIRDRHVSAHLNWPELLSGALLGLAGVALARGDALQAARLLGAASCYPDPGPSVFFRLDREADITAAQTQLGGARFDAAFAEGETMSEEASIRYALEATRARSNASRRGGGSRKPRSSQTKEM